MFIIAVIGSKSSGKTTTVETLVKGLTQKGYRVATIKHIPEEEFTIDTEGKDTWRHARAGAGTVISVAPKEIAILKKENTKSFILDHMLSYCMDAEIVILEGFRDLVRQEPRVFKIVTVKNSEEAAEAAENFKPILTFSGVGALKASKSGLNFPFVDAVKEPEKLLELVIEKISKIGMKPSEGLALYVNGKYVTLNPFVQRIIKKTILAMTSTLKDVKITGEENVAVRIYV